MLIVTVTISRGTEEVIVLRGNALDTLDWHPPFGAELVDGVDGHRLLCGFAYRPHVTTASELDRASP